MRQRTVATTATTQKAETIVIAWIEKKAPMGDLIEAIAEALAEADAFGGIRALRERVEVLEASVKRLETRPRTPMRRCTTCGKWTRESTAGCDYCDTEDK